MGFVQLPLEQGGSSHRYMIDEIGDVGAGYSFQSLSASYTGPVVEIRRDSDDDTQDFTAAQIVLGELDTFLTATTGFVVTWYDQSGDGFDLEEPSEPSQPQAIKDSNGYWYPNYTQKNLASLLFLGATTNSTVHVIWQCLSNGAVAVTSPQGGINLGSGNNILVPWWTTEQSPTFRGTNQSPFNWCDNKPRQHIYKFLNGTQTSFEYGSNGRTSFTIANPTYDELTVGSSLVDGNLRIYELIVFTKDADQSTIFSITKNNYPLMFEQETLWLNMGDSNTAAGFAHLGSTWTSFQIADQPISEPYYSRAHGALTIQDFLDSPEDVTFYLENFTYTDANVIIFLGTNDLVLDGITGAQAYDKLCDLAEIMRTAGATTVAAITMLPRTTGAPNFSTYRDDFNTLLIANAGGVFDVVINTTANPNLQNQNDTAYFADTTHLNDAGQQQLTNLVVAAF
jgi:hypothetical protein